MTETKKNEVRAFFTGAGNPYRLENPGHIETLVHAIDPLLAPDDETIARTAIEAIGALEATDVPVAPWTETDEDLKAAYMNTVAFYRKFKELTPKQVHDSFVAQATEDGWKVGPVNDPEKKENPLLVPYEELPSSHVLRDKVFYAVTRSLLS